jgi:hypothetical protein
MHVSYEEDTCPSSIYQSVFPQAFGYCLLCKHFIREFFKFLKKTGDLRAVMVGEKRP